jgi:hypothetical protein
MLLLAPNIPGGALKISIFNVGGWPPYSAASA